jgi:hypothetical protein
MKGQTLIVQFLLFFLIGLGLFVTIGGAFRLHSDLLREDIAKADRNLVGSYISSLAVSMVNSCKECDSITHTVKLEETTANYVTVLNLSNQGLKVSSEPGEKIIITSLHNIKPPIELIDSSASSTKPIRLTYNREGNSLAIGSS